VTVAGTTTWSLLLASETTIPDEGAAAVNVTVPVAGSPPVTVLVANDTVLNAAVVDVGEDGDPLHATPRISHGDMTKSDVRRRAIAWCMGNVRRVVQGRRHVSRFSTRPAITGRVTPLSSACRTSTTHRRKSQVSSRKSQAEVSSLKSN
jgi:hypothetical protein